MVVKMLKEKEGREGGKKGGRKEGSEGRTLLWENWAEIWSFHF
jgi:hypothetical protein